MSLPGRKARANKKRASQESSNLPKEQNQLALSSKQDGGQRSFATGSQETSRSQSGPNLPSRKSPAAQLVGNGRTSYLARVTGGESAGTGVIRPPPLTNTGYNTSNLPTALQDNLSPLGSTEDGWGGVTVDSPEIMSPAASLYSPRSNAHRQYTNMSAQGTASESLLTSRPRSPSLEQTTTSSQSHWHALREAMASTSSLTSPPSFLNHPPPTAVPLQPNTPAASIKSSKFPRFGFKHVVEQVTKEVYSDASMRFEDDIRQACWMAKFGVGITHDSEREPMYMTPLQTPGASTFSLPLTASTSNSIQESAKLMGRRPSAGLQNAQCSLQPLQHVLLRHAPLTTSATGPSRNRLPRESEILAVLVSPFLSRETGKRAEEERWLSVDIFELVTKTWHSSSPEAELERWLWCCHVAESGHPVLRKRALLILASTLFQQDAWWGTRNPLSLQILIRSVAILPRSRSRESDESDDKLVWDITSRIFRGDCGPLVAKELTDVYGVICSAGDEEREAELRKGVLIDGILRSMQVGSEGTRRWALQNLVEMHWPAASIAPGRTLSPLEQQIHLRKINAFSRCSLALLCAPSHTTVNPLMTRQDSNIILRIVQSRVIPELQEIAGHSKTPELVESQRLAVRLTLILLSSYNHRDRELSGQILETWWKDLDGWKDNLEREIRDQISHEDWTACVQMLNGFVKSLNDEVNSALMSFSIPLLFDRLEVDSPSPNTGLTTLLKSLANAFPRLFYKPLFACAASSKDATVVTQLRNVMAISQHMPDLWTSDAEMMAVALLSSPGLNSTAKGKQNEDNLVSPWGKPKLGQYMILVELIGHIKRLGEKKKDFASQPDSSQAEEVRFIGSLESKLAILMDAQEQHTLMPFSQRILLTCLLYEMRMFTRSLKPAPWLHRIILWVTHAYEGASISAPTRGSSPGSEILVTKEVLDEIAVTVTRIGFVYMECSSRRQSLNLKNLRRSGLRLSTSLPVVDSLHPSSDVSPGTDKQLILNSLPSRLATATLTLLVAICGLVMADEHKTLSPVLWDYYLGDNDKSIVSPACFLLMQCAEKAPNDLISRMHRDLSNPSHLVRILAIERIGTLFSWRLQLLNQPFIPDRARRRPFRLARQPISFVATDVGSSHYVQPEPIEETKIKVGANLPPELRRRVLELGWGVDEREDVHEKQQFCQVPLSLLPYQEIEGMNSVREKHIVTDKDDETGPRENKGLIRRKSSSSGYITGLKRKAIMPPPLLPVLETVSRAICDSNIEVSETARDLVLILIRDDPAILARPVMEGLSRGVVEGDSSFSSLRTYIHSQSPLPPGLAHHIFNHLAGLLKTATRQNNHLADVTLAQALPIMAKVLPHISNISVRELRRNKLDPLVFPSFSAIPVPSSESLDGANLSQPLVHVFMIRTAQNLLLLRLLEHNPKEINVVRKNFSQVPYLHVGLESSGRVPELTDYVPSRQTPLTSKPNKTVQRMSGILARSYLLLIAQIFRSLGRHMNDRSEMAKFMDGANRILINHGDDAGIVSHALIAFMVASTRFRRLFVSKSGFTLFMPSLLKVYCEAGDRPSVRSAIEYAISRFYALHKETFVFQTLEVASHILSQLRRSKNEDAEWFSHDVFSLIATLSKTSMTKDIDAAGIHGVNQEQERDALIILVNEKPELLMPSLARSSSRSNPVVEEDQLSVGTEGFDMEHFSLDDFVRLFLTVIPHNPQVIRSQLFLTLFRYLVPSLYNASTTARTVLRDGIQAFATAVFERLQNRNRVAEGNAIRSVEDPTSEVLRSDPSVDDVFGVKPMTPNDRSVMRREYLLLVAAFATAGGQLERTSLIKILQLLRDALRENIQAMAEPAAEVVNQFSRQLLLKEGNLSTRSGIAMLKEIVPLFRLYSSSVDFTETIQTLSQLAQDAAYSTDKEFIKMVAADFCAPAIQTCHIAGSEGVLFELSMRKGVVSLLANSVALPGVDVLAGLERHAPTSSFLAGIVLPLCLQLKTSLQVAAENQWQDIWKQEAHRRAWVRLLAYAMAIADDSTLVGDSNSKGDEEASDKGRSSGKASEEKAIALVMSLQIIKIIAIRAEKDISLTAPGIWSKMAIFMNVLSDGNGMFALHPTTLSSPSPTDNFRPFSSVGRSGSIPIHEPNRSMSGDDQRYSIASGGSVASAVRLVDYLLWSLLELVCRHRFPLTVHLRYWVQEKMLDLDAQLRSSSVSSVGGRVQSMIGRPESRRISTVFSKPRMRGQGKHSGGPSPEGSPLVGAAPSPSHSRSPSLLSLENTSGQAGLGPNSQFASYNRFPDASPIQRSDFAPRILHLGPSSKFTSEPLLAPPMLIQPASNDPADALRLSLKQASVANMNLVRATHRRVRIVQSSMGYDPLPMVGESESNEGFAEMDGRAWTKTEALHSVVQELRELYQEFNITGGN